MHQLIQGDVGGVGNKTGKLCLYRFQLVGMLKQGGFNLLDKVTKFNCFPLQLSRFQLSCKGLNVDGITGYAPISGAAHTLELALILPSHGLGLFDSLSPYPMDKGWKWDSDGFIHGCISFITADSYSTLPCISYECAATNGC